MKWPYLDNEAEMKGEKPRNGRAEKPVVARFESASMARERRPNRALEVREADPRLRGDSRDAPAAGMTSFRSEISPNRGRASPLAPIRVRIIIHNHKCVQSLDELPKCNLRTFHKEGFFFKAVSSNTRCVVEYDLKFFFVFVVQIFGVKRREFFQTTVDDDEGKLHRMRHALTRMFSNKKNEFCVKLWEIKVVENYFK